MSKRSTDLGAVVTAVSDSKLSKLTRRQTFVLLLVLTVLGLSAFVLTRRMTQRDAPRDRSAVTINARTINGGVATSLADSAPAFNVNTGTAHEDGLPARPEPSHQPREPEPFPSTDQKKRLEPVYTVVATFPETSQVFEYKAYVDGETSPFASGTYSPERTAHEFPGSVRGNQSWNVPQMSLRAPVQRRVLFAVKGVVRSGIHRSQVWGVSVGLHQTDRVSAGSNEVIGSKNESDQGRGGLNESEWRVIADFPLL